LILNNTRYMVFPHFFVLPTAYWIIKSTWASWPYIRYLRFRLLTLAVKDCLKLENEIFVDWLQDGARTD
jgi:hypothetical protein